MGDTSVIGILGGSGLYEMAEMEITEEVFVDTPFGEPSDRFIRGRLSGVDVVFLSRHGRGHLVSAAFVNYRANIYGFKTLGVDTLISFNAVGSMKEEYRPTDIVLPDQFFDISKKRESSFYSACPSVHVDVADPVCPVLNRALFSAGGKTGAAVHLGGIALTIEGPAFSTRAESEIHRSWGIDIIGMTMATEAKLAREAEICYSSLSLVTDYDVWKEAEDDVTFDMILANLRESADTAKSILKEAVPTVPRSRDCSCRNALQYAIATSPEAVPEDIRKQYEVLLGKYLPPEE